MPVKTRSVTTLFTFYFYFTLMKTVLRCSLRKHLINKHGQLKSFQYSVNQMIKSHMILTIEEHRRKYKAHNHTSTDTHIAVKYLTNVYFLLESGDVLVNPHPGKDYMYLYMILICAFIMCCNGSVIFSDGFPLFFCQNYFAPSDFFVIKNLIIKFCRYIFRTPQKSEKKLQL